MQPFSDAKDGLRHRDPPSFTHASLGNPELLHPSASSNFRDLTRFIPLETWNILSLSQPFRVPHAFTLQV